MKNSILFFILLVTAFSQSQTESAKLPYYEIPEYSNEYTAGTTAARMVDGLGFRFYWSSEGLTEKDLQYRPNEEVRSTEETIDHILRLSYIIVNSTLKQPNGELEAADLSYLEKRTQILENLKTAADILRTSEDISQYKIIFGEKEYPFWNQINGPIADAIWHCGQLASFRRTTGNPINPNISQFKGIVKQ
ncbi:hypothetical protein [uncultured Psychroserpens sp.]|uniref:hypothetical protein n=1 Tax=uncultured Psychroserpens sp. TaxID=255436 RepID=UPI002633E8F1|nr:hypothetical protein [uncultured Psychroserpens sp.]